MTTTAEQPPSKPQGELAPIGPDLLDRQRDFLRYARNHVRGVAWRARFASVAVAVAAILLTAGASAYSILNTLAVRDAVTRQMSAERDDLLRTLSANRDQLHQLVAGNIGQAAEDARTFRDLRQTLAKLQTTADSLTDTYAVISRDQAQILTALDAARKQLDTAQSTADRALNAAADARAAAASAALPLDQVARIADSQKTVERSVQLARTDLGEIQSALTLVQESKERGLPRLAAILEEAEVARSRLSTLVKDAAALRDAIPAAPTPQSASTDPQPWPEPKEAAQPR